MYLIVIGWLYVALMMSVAEATNTTGTVLGAVITFVLYGMLPVALVVYLLGTPGRRKAIRAREAQEIAAARTQTHSQAQAAEPSAQPDGSGETPADPVAPVRKES